MTKNIADKIFYFQENVLLLSPFASTHTHLLASFLTKTTLLRIVVGRVTCLVSRVTGMLFGNFLVFGQIVNKTQNMCHCVSNWLDRIRLLWGFTQILYTISPYKNR